VFHAVLAARPSAEGCALHTCQKTANGGARQSGKSALFGREKCQIAWSIDTEDAGTNAAHTRAAEIGVIESRAQRLEVRKSLNWLREKPQNAKLKVPSYSPGMYFDVITGKYFDVIKGSRRGLPRWLLPYVIS
jgi:hypothetical protein